MTNRKPVKKAREWWLVKRAHCVGTVVSTRAAAESSFAAITRAAETWVDVYPRQTPELEIVHVREVLPQRKPKKGNRR